MSTRSEESQEFADREFDDGTLQKEIIPADDVRDDERTVGQVVNGQDEVDRGQACTIMGRPVQNPMAIGTISAPVNFGGPQEIAIKTTNNNIGQQNSTYIRKQVTINQICSSCHGNTSVSDSEDNETWTSNRADISDVIPEDVTRAVELLDQNRRVALCGPPGSGKSSLGRAILTHYHQRGFKACLVSKLCCQCQQSFCKRKQTIILLDGGFGVVRLDSEQYDRCQDLINNTQCLLVLTVYPHLLRDMAVLKTRRPRELLPSSLVIDMKPRPYGTHNDCAPSVSDYLPLFQHMLHDTNFGRPMAALLALSMLGSYSLESDPPELKSDLQRLGFHGVDHYRLKQLAYNFRGSILPETGPGFASRLVYDAAGLALGSLHSTSVLLQVCDVTFLVQHVRTSGTPGEPHVLIGSTDRDCLMQRMYETMVDGQLSVMCQHPLLECPDFLLDLEDFLTHRKNYIQRLLNAVDRKNGLSLINSFLCSHSATLTYWCLGIMIKHCTDGNVLSESLLSAATAPILFPQAKDGAKSKFKGFLNQAIHLYVKPEQKNILKLTMLLSTCFPIKTKKNSSAELQKSLQTQRLCYLDDPSLPIPATLLLVTVTEDAVSVELPSQHWYMALRLLADREVDETDRDGNTLLHIAADKGNLEAITLAVKSGASLTKTNTKGLTPYQLAQRRQNSYRQRDNMGSNLNPAIRAGNEVTVKTHLCCESNIDDDERKGCTYLSVACEHGHGNIANLLIDLGADFNGHVPSGSRGPWKPLHHACRKGLTQTAVLLVKQHADITATSNYGETALHLACQCESPTASADITRLLLDAGADVNARDKKGDTPLHNASLRRQKQTIKLLVDQGADVNAGDESGNTALHHALHEGYMETVALLIDVGADMNAPDGCGDTMLCFALRTGHTESLTLLIDRGADVNARGADGNTPLHQAFCTGHPGIITLLIDRGADVNARGADGNTPLHQAFCRGHTGTITLLIDHGADVNARDNNNKTPLHRAFNMESPGIITQLIEAGAEIGRVHQAVVRGDVDVLMTLLQQGADVNQHDTSMGCSPLHAACLMGRTNIVTCLIQHGAKVNAVDVWTQTPLHHACETGAAEIVTCLTQHGAKVNAVAVMKRTPLHYALAFGHTQVARQLVDEGADVNARDKRQSTPLHGAALTDNAEITLCLIEHGAEVNAAAVFGVTPLHDACMSGHTETVVCLLQHGADVDAVSEWPGTPLQAACEDGHTQTVQCLLQHGADVNDVSKWDGTPLHIACKNGHYQTVQYLLQQGANVNAVSICWDTPLDTVRRYAPHSGDMMALLVEHGAVSRDQMKRTT